MTSGVQISRLGHNTGVLEKLIGKERKHFLGLVWLLVRRELQVKYRDSFLGYLWSMLNPLLTMSIVSFVFSHLIKGIPNYAMFILTGILFWNLVLHSLNTGTASLVNNAGLMRKIKVPAWVFPCVSLGSALVNMLLSFFPYLILYAIFGITPTINIVFFPLALGLFMIFLAGITMALASLNVFFRDIAHVLEPVLGLCFYGTPIIYERYGSVLPENVGRLLALNPFTHYIESMRSLLFIGKPVDAKIWIVLVICSMLSLFIGLTVYKKTKSKFIFHL